MAKTKTPIQRVLACPASAMLDAILDFALDNPKKRVSPEVTSLSITSDGFLMGWNTSRPDKEGLMGTASDLDRNLHGICAHVGLNEAETAEVVTAVYAKISDWRSAASRKGANPYSTKVG
jgi:hypothetical protein